MKTTKLPTPKRAAAFLTAFAVLALILVLAGCSHQNPLVGKWTASVPGAQMGAMSATYEFKADGTMTQTISMGSINQAIVANGTYVDNGSAFTETITAMSIRGREIPNTTGAKQTTSVAYRFDGDKLFIKQTGRAQELQLTRSN
jgi:hypothetical protein